MTFISYLKQLKNYTNNIELQTFGDCLQGAKKIIFTACHSGKLKLAFTSPTSFQLAPKTF